MALIMVGGVSRYQLKTFCSCPQELVLCPLGSLFLLPTTLTTSLKVRTWGGERENLLLLYLLHEELTLCKAKWWCIHYQGRGSLDLSSQCQCLLDLRTHYQRHADSFLWAGYCWSYMTMHLISDSLSCPGGACSMIVLHYPSQIVSDIWTQWKVRVTNFSPSVSHMIHILSYLLRVYLVHHWSSSSTSDDTLGTLAEVIYLTKSIYTIIGKINPT